MRSNIRGLIVSGLVGGALLAGCTTEKVTVKEVPVTGDGGVTGSGRVLRVEEIRAALRPIAEAQCKHWFDCCTEGERLIHTGQAVKDADACTDVLMEMAESGATNVPYYGNPLPEALDAMKYLEYGFDLSKVTLSDKAITACVKQLAGADCNAAQPVDHCEPNAKTEVPDACAPSKLLVGTEEEGGDCVRSPQFLVTLGCAPGLACVPVDQGHGVCLKPPADGMRCSDTYGCPDGTICDHQSGRCAPGLEVGDACAYSDPNHPVQGTEKTPCRAGLICDIQALKCADAACAAGTSCNEDKTCPKGLRCIGGACAPLAGAGKPCNANDQCVSGLCRSNAQGGSQVCAVPHGDGAACNSHEDCKSGFCISSDGLAPTCTPQVAGGKACPTGQDPQCLNGRCSLDPADGYVCVAVGKAGDACVGNEDCDVQGELACIKSVCKKGPFANGDPCPSGANESCTSRFCDGSKCRARAKLSAACSSLSTPDSAPPCDDDLYCDAPDPTNPAGKCRALKGSGETCATEVECRGRGCQPIAGALRCIEYGRRTMCTGAP